MEKARHAVDAREAIRRAGVFILTAGLTEVWYNIEDGSTFFQVPPAKVYDPERHGFRVLDLEENTLNLRAAIMDIRRINPDCHIILTVSPVPLRATFRPLNVVTANAQSKATLIGAVHQAIESAEDSRVHYFPSYEIVTVMTANPFKPDNRHIRPGVLKRVMDVFVRSFVQ
jgi:hypothetical protein